MNFPDIHYDIVNNSIMVAGLYRSGTTILGKLLGSFKNAEYIFEPPMVLHLDYLVQRKKIDDTLAADILRTNLAEDYMLNFLHGRRYNMRPCDDSSVFVMKSYDDSVGRWLKIKRLKNAIDFYRAHDFRLIFKNAAKYSIIPVLLKNYTSCRIVEIIRDLRSVLSSLLARGWFSNKAVKDSEYGIWPFNKDNLVKVPYVGEGSDIEEYETANEETRAIDFINAKMRNRFEAKEIIDSKYKSSIHTMKYEDMIKDARATAIDISNFIQMDLSPKTDELIKTVKETNRVHNIDKVLLNCDKKIVKKFLNYNGQLGYED